jgi:ATP synthase protein I
MNFAEGWLLPVPLKTPPKYKEAFDQISRYGTVGLELGVSVAIGIAIGFYLDKWLDTSPWLTIFMMLCGTVSGFIRIYRALKEIEKEEQQDDAG